jgi:hypothetical protein
MKPKIRELLRKSKTATDYLSILLLRNQSKMLSLSMRHLSDLPLLTPASETTQRLDAFLAMIYPAKINFLEDVNPRSKPLNWISKAYRITRSMRLRYETSHLDSRIA